jgi:hypothetical protein
MGAAREIRARAEIRSTFLDFSSAFTRRSAEAVRERLLADCVSSQYILKYASMQVSVCRKMLGFGRRLAP